MAGHHTHDSRGPLPVEPLPLAVLGARNVCGLAGALGMGVLLLCTLFDGTKHEAFRSLLFGFHFWLGPTLGALVFVCISHMTGGGWGVVYRRFGEAAFGNWLWMLIVCVLLMLGYNELFPWYHLADYKGDPEAFKVMSSRLPWYSPLWFIVRQLAYFAIWGTVAFLLRAGSLRLDEGASALRRRNLRKVSAAGVVLFFITVTSYGMDYVMSRETNWYSSINGFVTVIEFGASGVALCTLTLCYFAERKPFRDVLSPQHLNDLGNLLLALVILWMYTNFAQFLIQWNGNLRGDIGYYVIRGMGTVPNNWRFVALALFLGHFLLPFFLLLMKGLKRKIGTLARICVWLLIMRVVETLWVVAPPNSLPVAHPGAAGQIYWTDLFAFVGVGGIWMFLYLRRLGLTPMLPQNATDQPEPMIHGTHGTPAHAL